MSFSSYLSNQGTTPKHKAFISFHHKNDVDYKEHLETEWGEQFDGFVPNSVKDGDIDPRLPADRIRQIIRDDFIADATVTVVLVGEGTWRRKHVDWEIGSSIRDTKNNPRTGLIGILLPTYPTYIPYGLSTSDVEYTENGGIYIPYTIPPRLYDNIEIGYAKIYSWPSSPSELKEWIHDAFNKRKTVTPTNSRDGFSKNRSETQTHWQG